MDTKLKIDKLGQKPRYNSGGTSALSMVRSNSKPLSSAVRSNQHSSQLTISKAVHILQPRSLG
uniref:SLAIN motif-containing protein 2 n=1 Tax=Loa loa TaxID=7209 RepID=A0A1I7VNI7_LOALO